MSRRRGRRDGFYLKSEKGARCDSFVLGVASAFGRVKREPVAMRTDGQREKVIMNFLHKG